ncbi:DUF4352 domain-containing protein [Zhihengliuella flava]|uniref:DUF4352 domain-containing protein n=1 Tax=Zhihengliuella flava TaxID=1285193 RepID=A0A931D8L5_9MICC|nr:hypothetical protein [Zhihengliuella flava]MBG6084427.1 hypothetical protein [Zhihengliuella flava]
MSQYTAPAPTPPAPVKSSAGKGLGIAALVIAIIALLLSAVPIINNAAAVLGFIALILGITSLVVAAKKNGGKGFGIASSIIAVVAIVVVFATQAFYTAALDEVERSFNESMEEAETGVRDADPAEVAAGASAAADGDTAEAATDQADVTQEALTPGATAAVGDYEVTVDAVNLDATEDVAAANEFNSPAEGQYVLTDLSVTYTGDEEGTPWLDLNLELVGSDARIYSTTTCVAVLENSAIDQPNLSAGGSSSYQACFDVPAEATEGAQVRVGSTFDFSGEDFKVWAAQ